MVHGNATMIEQTGLKIVYNVEQCMKANPADNINTNLK